MKRLLLVAALTVAAAPALAQVGVSVNIGEPGFYGQIQLGNSYPPPQVIYQQPVVIEQVPESLGPPVYLRVPPGYARHWDRHCAEYNACGHRVYFVQDSWYNNVYAPRYHEDHYGPGPEHRDDHDRGDDHGHGHGHDDHGRGNDDHGRGHDERDHHDH